MIAAGGWKKVTPSMIRLTEYLTKEISLKRREPSQLNEDTYIQIMGLEELVKQGKKKRLQGKIRDDIEAAKNMGLIRKIKEIECL